MNSKKKAVSELMERFKQCEDNIYICSKSELFEELWLKNSNSNLLQQAEELNVPFNLRDIFYSEMDFNMVYRFDSALKPSPEVDFLVSTNGYICRTCYLAHTSDEFLDRELTDEEEDLLLKVQRIVMNRLGCKTLDLVATRGLGIKYNELFKEEMQKVGSSIEYVYEAYKFRFLKD